jgi:hypothetical protein
MEVAMFLSYDYDDDLVCAAVEYYTRSWCGEFDVDFYRDVMYCCYNDHTLEVLIVHDFLEKIFEDVLTDLPVEFAKYKKALDDWDRVESKRFERR